MSELWERRIGEECSEFKYCFIFFQQSTEKNEKEQYKLLLRLVAAGLEKKSEEQPSISASKTTHVLVSMITIFICNGNNKFYAMPITSARQAVEQNVFVLKFETKA